MKLLKALVVSSVLSVGSVLLPATANAEQKIAVVDTQRAVMETEDGMRAEATLKKLFDSRQKEIDKKQADFQKEQEDLAKQRGKMSNDVLQKKLEQLQKEMLEFQTQATEYQKELQKKQSDLTQPILQKTLGLIRRLATQEGYDLVVDKQAAPYVRSDLDLTDRVIAMYNQGAATDTPAKPGPAKPAPAKKK